MAEIGQAREVDHPGEQQIIEIGLNSGQGAKADRRPDQGEVDVGGDTLAAQGAGAVDDRLLHLRMGGQHLLDGLDRVFGEAEAPGRLRRRGGDHRSAAARPVKRSFRDEKAG